MSDKWSILFKLNLKVALIGPNSKIIYNYIILLKKTNNKDVTIILYLDNGYAFSTYQ